MSIDPKVQEIIWLWRERGIGEAVPKAAALCQERPDDADVIALDAFMKLFSGNLEEAHKRADSALLWDSQRPLPQLAKAHVEGFSANFEEAFNRAEKVLTLAENEPMVLEMVSAIYALCNRRLEALGLMDRAKEITPESGPKWYEQCNSRHLLNDQAGAEEALKILQERYPDFYGTYVQLGREAGRRGDTIKAEEYARYAVAAAPENTSAWTLLSQTLIQQDKVKEAEQAARHALELNAREIGALKVMARVARINGDMRAASELSVAAANAVPALAFGPFLEKTSMLMRMGRREQALRELHQAEQTLHPFIVGFSRPRLMVLYAELGDWESVRRLANEIEAEGRKIPELAVARSALAHHDGRHEEALRILREGLDAFPGDLTIAGPLLERLNEQGKAEERDALIEEVQQMEQRDAFASAHMIFVFLRMGKKDEARQLLRKVERAFPESKAVKTAEAAILSEEGRHEEAANIVQTLGAEYAPMPVRVGCLQFLRLVAIVLWRKLTGRGRDGGRH